MKIRANHRASKKRSLGAWAWIYSSTSNFLKNFIYLKVNFRSSNTWWLQPVLPPVFLHFIFEISSVTRFFFNFEISSLKNQKINLISKLIFAGYTGSKNQVRTRQKIKFVSKLIFFSSLKLKKKIKWHSIFQKSSGDRQGVRQK